jgi:hypothetical protein
MQCEAVAWLHVGVHVGWADTPLLVPQRDVFRGDTRVTEVVAIRRTRTDTSDWNASVDHTIIHSKNHCGVDGVIG